VRQWVTIGTMSDHTPDWTAIESSDEFRRLSASRQRFAAIAGGIGIGAGLLFIVLAHTARDLMAEKVAGGMSLGFLLGVCMVLIAFVITALYARRAQRVWAPMEQAVRDRAAGR
jgi:uncharacterized membrane protein (DUF485 family)